MVLDREYRLKKTYATVKDLPTIDDIYAGRTNNINTKSAVSLEAAGGIEIQSQKIKNVSGAGWSWGFGQDDELEVADVEASKVKAKKVRV